MTAPMREPLPGESKLMRREETESLLRRLALAVAVLFIGAITVVAWLDRLDRNEMIDRNAQLICHYGKALNLPPARECPLRR